MKIMDLGFVGTPAIDGRRRALRAAARRRQSVAAAMLRILLLASIKESGAAYAYPTIQHFGDSTARLSCAPYDPQRFVFGNYIDAMALLSREAWAIVGGFRAYPARLGRLRPLVPPCGDRPRQASGATKRWPSTASIPRSMLKTETTVGENFHRLFGIFEASPSLGLRFYDRSCVSVSPRKPRSD